MITTARSGPQMHIQKAFATGNNSHMLFVFVALPSGDTVASRAILRQCTGAYQP